MNRKGWEKAIKDSGLRKLAEDAGVPVEVAEGGANYGITKLNISFSQDDPQSPEPEYEELIG